MGRVRGSTGQFLNSLPRRFQTIDSHINEDVVINKSTQNSDFVYCV